MAIRAIFLLLLFSSSVAYGDNFVGQEFPPYPDGYESKNGACIAHALGLAHICDFSLLELSKGKPRYILAAKKSGMHDKKPKWRITDQVPYPPIAEGQFLALGLCQINGEADHTVAAVVIESDDKWVKAANWAIRVNLASGKIEKISPQGVECENHGLDQ